MMMDEAVDGMNMTPVMDGMNMRTDVVAMTTMTVVIATTMMTAEDGESTPPVMRMTVATITAGTQHQIPRDPIAPGVIAAEIIGTDPVATAAAKPTATTTRRGTRVHGTAMANGQKS